MTLESHTNYRILLIDNNDYDRELLSLSLRSQLQHAVVLTANSALEFAGHLAAGNIDAVVSEAHFDWGSPFELAAIARRHNGACAICLFTSVERKTEDELCIGRRIDVNLVKDSAGFLELPKQLERIWTRQADLAQWLPRGLSISASDLGPLPGFLLLDRGYVCASNSAFEHSLMLPMYRYASMRIDKLFDVTDRRPDWQEAFRQPHGADDAIVLDVTTRTEKQDGLAFRMVLRPLVHEDSCVRIWSGVLLDSTLLAVSRTVTSDSGTKPESNIPVAQVLSHDLQQPLQNVVRQASWLIEKHGQAMSSDALATAQHVYASSLRMQEMVDGALDLFRVGQNPQQFAPVDLNLVVRQALENLTMAIEASAATVEAASLPTVQGNRAQLVQVFQNLIANAIKFCRDRLPRIRISSVRTSKGWQIRLVDNGIGIRPEDTRRIFELYQRLHTDEEFPGTGVGLALCKRIIESHGGKISVESLPGKGSVFVLDFVTTDTATA